MKSERAYKSRKRALKIFEKDKNIKTILTNNKDNLIDIKIQAENI